MIGRVCSVFNETLESCLAMTPEQLRNLYWEAREIEASKKLVLLDVLLITQMEPDKANARIQTLQLQADAKSFVDDSPDFGRDTMEKAIQVVKEVEERNARLGRRNKKSNRGT